MNRAPNTSFTQALLTDIYPSTKGDIYPGTKVAVLGNMHKNKGGKLTARTIYNPPKKCYNLPVSIRVGP